MVDLGAGRAAASRLLLLIVVALAVGVQPRPARAGVAGLTRVANGLSAPIFATHAPGDSSRLFIVQRGGVIRILNLATNTLEPTPFLSIPSVDAGGEGGLLGMAFHPDYATNGKFYVNVTIDNGGQTFLGATSPFSSHIREYTVSANPNVANSTPTPILNIVRPQDNHVGGWIGFSPHDEFLYIMSGDGGGGGDTGIGHHPTTGNAQDITGGNLLGKVLRIDVNGDQYPGDVNRNYRIPGFQTATTNPFAPKPDPANPGMFIDPAGDDEIWAYGVRNPFRASFDRATDDLWIGDVGQGAREEIDFQAADFPGGANYGWRLREGTLGTVTPPGYVGPVYDYDRDADQFGGTVVTGGYIYRGPDPTLQGKYFFADSRNTSLTTDDNYWMFDPANPYGTVTNIDLQLLPTPPAVSTVQFPASFGEDANGNLYVVYIGSGEVYRINTNAFTPGDFNGDAMVDDDDLAVWRTNFGTTAGATRTTGDSDGDGDVDGEDFLNWQENLGWSALNVPGGSAPVPEPAASILFSLAAIASIKRRRRPG